jgi:hypothetical protein
MESGWIGHDGGECPLAGNDFIEPVYRAAENSEKGVRRSCGYAFQFAWRWDGEDDDIMAYRILESPF